MGCASARGLFLTARVVLLFSLMKLFPVLLGALLHSPISVLDRWIRAKPWMLGSVVCVSHTSNRDKSGYKLDGFFRH